MDSSFQFDIISFDKNGKIVSILVLIDSSFQYLVLTDPPYGTKSFNPCFNGFFFSIRASLCFVYYFLVSILVLMDSSFQSPISLHISSQYCCFNPCFNGFFFSIPGLISSLTKPKVSILVLMDSSFQ